MGKNFCLRVELLCTKYHWEGHPQQLGSCVLASLIWKAILCFLQSLLQLFGKGAGEGVVVVFMPGLVLEKPFPLGPISAAKCWWIFAHLWSYLATGSILAGVSEIKKCCCWRSETSTRTNHQWCRSIFFLLWLHLTKTGTTGDWSRGFKPGFYFFCCCSIPALAQILQPRLQLWGPSLSLHVQHFHWSLSRQAACFAAGIINFFKRWSAQPMFFSSSTKIFINKMFLCSWHWCVRLKGVQHFWGEERESQWQKSL